MRISLATALLAVMLAAAGCDGGGSDTPAAAHVETIAGGSVGDGRLATEVPLDASDVATDRQGNIYLNDHARVRRIDRGSGRISTIAGGDDPAQCRYTIGTRPACLHVSGLTLDSKDRIYATDSYESAIVSIEPTTGAITFIAEAAYPESITADATGHVFVYDVDDARILRIDVRTGVISIAAGNGDGESTAAECPRDVSATATCVGRFASLATDREGGLLLISGDGFPVLRRVDPESGILSAMLVPNGSVAVDARNRFVVSLPAEDRVVRADPTTGAVTPLIAGTADDPLAPRAVAVDAEGRTLVLTDDHRLLRLDRAGGKPEVVAGNGSADDCGDGGAATDACLGRMSDLDVAPNGDVVLAEWSGSIRVIDADDGRIDTLTELRESPIGACSQPFRVAVGPAGDAFVAGSIFTACRVDHVTGAVSLVAGDGSCDGFGNPLPREGDPAVGACLFVTDLLVAADGGLLIADNYKPRIWRVDPVTGRLAVVAGTGQGGPCGSIGDGDGGDARAACVSPFRLGQDGAGNIYVLEDSGLGDGARVRRIDALTGVITTVAGIGKTGDCGDGGPAVEACLAARNLLVDADGDLYLGGPAGVRKVDAATGVITTVYRDTRRFDLSLDAVDRAGRLLFFTDDATPSVRRLTLPAITR